MKKLSLYIFLILVVCNVGYANNDLIGIKLLCKDTKSTKWWNTPLKTYEFLNNFEVSINTLDSKDIEIRSYKHFYKSDLRKVYLYHNQKKYERHWKDGDKIEKDTLFVISNNREKSYTCSVIDKDKNLMEILIEELEILKLKILKNNKI